MTSEMFGCVYRFKFETSCAVETESTDEDTDYSGLN
jgi:hypothetical protein